MQETAPKAVAVTDFATGARGGGSGTFTHRDLDGKPDPALCYPRHCEAGWLRTFAKTFRSQSVFHYAFSTPFFAAITCERPLKNAAIRSGDHIAISFMSTLIAT